MRRGRLTGNRGGHGGTSKRERVGRLEELFENFDRPKFDEHVIIMEDGALSSPEVRTAAQAGIVDCLRRGDSYSAGQIKEAVGLGDEALLTPEARQAARGAALVKLGEGEWFQTDGLMRATSITAERYSPEMQEAAKKGVLAELKKNSLWGAGILFQYALTQEEIANLVQTPEYARAVEKAVLAGLQAPDVDAVQDTTVDRGPVVLQETYHVSAEVISSKKVQAAARMRFGSKLEKVATKDYWSGIAIYGWKPDWDGLVGFRDAWNIGANDVHAQVKRTLVKLMRAPGYMNFERVLKILADLGTEFSVPDAFLRDTEIQDAAVEQAKYTLGYWPDHALDVVRRFGITQQRLVSPEFRRAAVAGCAESLGYDLEKASRIAEGFRLTDAERQSDEIQDRARQALAALLEKKDSARARRLIQEFRITTDNPK